MKITNQEHQNIRANQQAIENDADLKLNCEILILPDGTMQFPWWNGKIQKFINAVAPDVGQSMMKQNHLCG